MSDKTPSYLDLSDEEFLNTPIEETQVVEEEVQEDEPAQEVNEEDNEVKEESVDTTDETDSNDVESEEETTDAESNNEVVDTETDIDKQKEVKDSIDYKAEYERLMAPFKANGRDISVKSVEDAITLMQMGANYSKKMAGLKPHLKLMKMLEKNDLLDESKLSYLIDLHGRNPAAISKLIKDSGIDPHEVDTEEAANYKPKSYAIDDKEMELDSVLEEIKDSPNYHKTLATISTDWDAASKQTIASTPSLLKVINSHMDSGVFDLIQKEMESERLFGRLNGLSDIEAYRKVGDAINARGGFAFLAGNQQPQPNKQVVITKPSAQVDDKTQNAKRAAAPVKAAVAKPVTKEFNPLALSDEEFAKYAQTLR